MARNPPEKSSDPLDRARQWIKHFKFGGGGDSSTDDEVALNFVDVRTPSRVNKIAQKVISLTKNPKLNLKNSPPYLQGILIDDVDLINSIFKRNSLDSLKSNEYFNKFLETFFRHCKRTLKLFKESKERMEDEASPWRRELNKVSLVFSHMLAELRTFFRDGAWVPEFKMVKLEAREFWDKAFPRRYMPLVC